MYCSSFVSYQILFQRVWSNFKVFVKDIFSELTFLEPEHFLFPFSVKLLSFNLLYIALYIFFSLFGPYIFDTQNSKNFINLVLTWN